MNGGEDGESVGCRIEDAYGLIATGERSKLTFKEYAFPSSSTQSM